MCIRDRAKPTLSGQTIPGNIRQGSSFDIRGIISSNEKLTAVTVGVYDTNGNMKIGKTVSPNAVSYNLKNLSLIHISSQFVHLSLLLHSSSITPSVLK